MKILTTILFIFLFKNLLFSQETIEITVKNGKEKEIYSVLTSDNSVKQGLFKSYYDNQLEFECYYTNNLKDGQYIEYYSSEKSMKKKGFYAKGKMNGNWIHYNINGVKSLSENYKDDILNGKWTEYSPNGNILIDGEYSEGLKDKIWIENYQNSTNQKSRTEYSLNKKIGLWEFKNPAGELIKKYDYDLKRLLYFKNDTAEIYYDEILSELPSDTTLQIEIDARYIPNNDEMKIDISKFIEYPQIALVEGLTGKVYVGFTINKQGIAENITVLKKMAGCPECDREVIRVVKIISDNWIPAVSNGQAVNSRFMLPITFNLQ